MMKNKNSSKAQRFLGIRIKDNWNNDMGEIEYAVACYVPVMASKTERIAELCSTWALDPNGNVYVSCLNYRCRTLNDLTKLLNYDEGRNNTDGGSCAICPKCAAHNWYYLEDWKEVWKK